MAKIAGCGSREIANNLTPDLLKALDLACQTGSRGRSHLLSHRLPLSRKMLSDRHLRAKRRPFARIGIEFAFPLDSDFGKEHGISHE